jgi:hypothetical protein
MNQLTIFCLILGFISWYYFNKFQESEKEYNKLYKRFEHVYIENQKVKSRIKDLQSYKNDVSKTFKILDNELVLINDHLKKQNENVTTDHQRSQRPPPVARSFYMRNIPSNNVSLLTPDLLTSLFNMNTLDTGRGSEQASSHAQPQQQEQQPSQQPSQQPLEQQPSQQQQSQEVTEEVIQEEVQSEESDKLDLQIDIDKIGLGDVLSGNGDNYEKYII